MMFEAIHTLQHPSPHLFHGFRDFKGLGAWGLRDSKGLGPLGRRLHVEACFVRMTGWVIDIVFLPVLSPSTLSPELDTSVEDCSEVLKERFRV